MRPNQGSRNRQKNRQRTIWGRTVLWLVCALCAAWAASLVPPLTDTVTVTALGEADPLSQSSQVEIAAVNGDENGIRPEEGKWFWKGRRYVWREESDPNQPEGTTRSVELAVPVGMGRSLDFVCGPRGGMVEVACQGEIFPVNLYEENEEMLTLFIPDSTDAAIYGQAALRVLVFLLLGAALCLGTWRAARWAMADRQRVPEWWSRRWAYLSIGAISLAMLILMIRYSGVQGFWFDEMCQLGFVHSGYSLRDMLRIYGTMQESSPPLFGVVAYVWYRIAPYGQRWLLLPSEIAVAGGVFALGAAGIRLKGERCGVLAALFGATSQIYLIQCGHEFRMYGFTILFSSLALLCYICRNRFQGEERKGHLIAYGICLAAVAYSHYLALFLCFSLFLLDLLIFLRKKVSIRFLYSYVLAGILFFPWGVVLLTQRERDITQWWPERPVLMSLVNVTRELLDNRMFVYAVYLIAFCLVLAACARWAVDRRINYSNDYLPFALLWVHVCTMCTVFFYSTVIAPSGSLFVTKYFRCLLPWMLLLCAWGLDTLCESLWTEQKARTVGVALCCFIALFSGGEAYSAVTRIGAVREPFREGAEWLLEQDDIYSPDTVVYLGSNSMVMYGWEDYYVGQLGRRDLFDVLPLDNNETQRFFHETSITRQVLEEGKYKRVYFFEPQDHYRMADPSREELLARYDQVHEESSVKVRVYERKTDEE